MHDTILKGFYDKFKLSTRQGTGGMTFKYVPNEDVINRMNRLFKGNWSTKVTFKDVVDDQVILAVEVSVVDVEDGKTHSHTGFGSQQIMRYNSGVNQGKIIDIGNAYKSALAKGIVNACTRWGVGLYKESDPMDAEMPIMPNMSAAVAVAIPAAVPAPVMPPAMAAPPTALPTPPAALAAPPVAVAVPPVAETITTFAPPAFAQQPVSSNIVVAQEAPTVTAAAPMPKVPAPAVNTIPTTPDLPFSNTGTAGNIADIGISDVQRVALNGILTMNNVDYGELALEAFSASGITKAVPQKEDLNYDEAVVVIKFGNDKYRKNR